MEILLSTIPNDKFKLLVVWILQEILALTYRSNFVFSEPRVICTKED